MLRVGVAGCAQYAARCRELEVVGANLEALTHEPCTQQYVFELPDVSRPGECAQPPDGLPRHRLSVAAVAGGENRDEMVDEQRDVFRSISEWRHVKLDHMEAVVQIL